MRKDVAPLIDALRGVDRERKSPDDSQWEALAMGALPARQMEELREQSLEDFEAYRPFDAEFRARTIERVLEAAQSLHVVVAHDPDDAVPISACAIPNRRQKLKAMSLRISAAAAALVCVFMLKGPRPELGAWGQITHKGGELKQRVAAQMREPVKMRDAKKPGGPQILNSAKIDYDVRLTAEKLTLQLKPIEGVDYEPKFRCELESMEKLEFLRWEPLSKPKILPRGTIRIEGTKAQMFPKVPAGTWQLLCAVGPEELPVERLSTLPPSAGKDQYAILVFDKLLILSDPPQRADDPGD